MITTFGRAWNGTCRVAGSAAAACGACVTAEAASAAGTVASPSAETARIAISETRTARSAGATDGHRRSCDARACNRCNWELLMTLHGYRHTGSTPPGRDQDLDCALWSCEG